MNHQQEKFFLNYPKRREAITDSSPFFCIFAAESVKLVVLSKICLGGESGNHRTFAADLYNETQ